MFVFTLYQLCGILLPSGIPSQHITAVNLGLASSGLEVIGVDSVKASPHIAPAASSREPRVVQPRTTRGFFIQISQVSRDGWLAFVFFAQDAGWSRHARCSLPRRPCWRFSTLRPMPAAPPHRPPALRQPCHPIALPLRSHLRHVKAHHCAGWTIQARRKHWRYSGSYSFG